MARSIEILLVVLLVAGCVSIPTIKKYEYFDKNDCKVLIPSKNLPNVATESLIQCGNVCCWAWEQYPGDDMIYVNGKYYTWVCDGTIISYQSCSGE